MHSRWQMRSSKRWERSESSIYDLVIFNVFVPDLIYISSERFALLTEKNLQGTPSLAVEILSPSTRSRDRRLKRDVYERTGVEEYWVIDPKHDEVDVYRYAAGRFAEAV